MAKQVPYFCTPLPGPKAQAIIARDELVTSPSYTRGYPFVMAHGQGVTVTDVDGNCFIDACAGIAVNSTGHSHPAVVAAIQAQASQFLHMSGTDFYYENFVELGEVLTRTSGMNEPAKVIYSNSGAEAIEAAIKLARYATGRSGLIAFSGAFHGRTMGALSLNASKVVHRHGFAPFIQPVYHVPYPNPYRQTSALASTMAALDQLFRQQISPTDIAAIVVEPLQGEGGYIVPPDGFLTALRKLCDQHQICLVVDEVQSGNGRTGKLWAFEYEPDFSPDIIATAKGLASGLPLGVVIAKSRLMTWPPGAHASTFGGNPLSCAAALATYALLHEGGLMANAQATGNYLRQGLLALQKRYPHCLGDIRGRGLMLGIEVVQDPQTKTPWPQLRDAWVTTAFYEGLLILGCGQNTIRLCPPLVITLPECDTLLALLEQALIKALDTTH
jgi:4-aminobutyrate aminotransferase